MVPPPIFNDTDLKVASTSYIVRLPSLHLTFFDLFIICFLYTVTFTALCYVLVWRENAASGKKVFSYNNKLFKNIKLKIAEN